MQITNTQLLRNYKWMKENKNERRKKTKIALYQNHKQKYTIFLCYGMTSPLCATRTNTFSAVQMIFDDKGALCTVHCWAVSLIFRIIRENNNVFA